jgi:hypothetical protein
MSVLHTAFHGARYSGTWANRDPLSRASAHLNDHGSEKVAPFLCGDRVPAAAREQHVAGVVFVLIQCDRQDGIAPLLELPLRHRLAGKAADALVVTEVERLAALRSMSRETGRLLISPAR